MKARGILTTTAVIGVTILVFVVAAHVARAAASRPTAQRVPGWERSITARSRALDRRYHLGSYQPIGQGVVPAGQHPQWLRALDLRSIALDREHHLGSFARPLAMPYPERR